MDLSAATQKNIVVGSGPTGVACVKGLLDAGCSVLLIDGGEHLESSLVEKIARLKVEEPSEWEEEILSSFRSPVKANAKGVKTKLAYGSDYPYRGEAETVARSTGIGHLTASLAEGGFSGVWGAAMLPYTAKDISDWPLRLDDLEEGYEAALSLLRLTTHNDRLKKAFPLYTEQTMELRASAQAQVVLERLAESTESLASLGVSFGHSRLAFRPEVSKQDSARNDCVYCGLCMYGCPYELIYSASHTLRSLLERFPSLLSYRPGVFVKSLQEEKDHITVTCRDRNTGNPLVFTSEKVFLGAGCLSTTRILLESIDAWETDVSIKVSEYFLLPLLGSAHKGSLKDPGVHTLSQVFLECENTAISEHSIHLQVYTFNDLYRKALKRIIGPLSFLANPLVRRLHVAQGYLHSTESSTILAKLTRSSGGRLEIQGKKNPYSTLKIKRFTKLLWRIRKKTALTPLLPMLSIGLPGEGRHVGGSFPMSRARHRFSSDLLGRPAGLKNIHIVDAACLPSIAAPTITLTAMANSYRIASAVSKKGANEHHHYKHSDNTSRMKKNNIAITGTSGFLGSVLLDSLRKEKYHLKELIRNPKSPSQIQFLLGSSPSPELFRDVSTLIHCAWDMSSTKENSLITTNVDGSIELFRSALEAGVERIIFISSISAFDDCRSIYGRCKLKVEKIVRECGGIIVRPGLVYGDMTTQGGMMGSLSRLVQSTPVVPTMSPPAVLYLAHKDDLASLVGTLIRSEHAFPEPIIAASDEAILFDELLRHLAGMHGSSLRTVPIPWRLMHLPLRTAELLGAQIGFKSDSLVSLMNSNPSPDFSPLRQLNIQFRRLTSPVDETLSVANG